MKYLLLLLFVSMSAAGAAEDEKAKACETQAYKFFPDPNYNANNQRLRQMGPGLDNNYLSDAPNVTDYERARKKREKYIRDCLAAD